MDNDMIATQPQLSYIACDIPEGMRVGQWRAMQAKPARRRRIAARLAIRPIDAIDGRRLGPLRG